MPPFSRQVLSSVSLRRQHVKHPVGITGQQHRRRRRRHRRRRAGGDRFGGYVDGGVGGGVGGAVGERVGSGVGGCVSRSPNSEAFVLFRAMIEKGVNAFLRLDIEKTQKRHLPRR